MPNGSSAPFKRRYPVSIFAVIVGVVSFHEKHGFAYGLEPPLTKAIRGPVEYAGFTYGHLRTILSLWKGEGLLVAAGSAKALRWSFGAKLQAVRASIDRGAANDDAFTLAVYAFSQDQARRRRIARDILKHYRFRMFAPNVYVSTLVDIPRVASSLAEYGLEKNVFLFRTSLSEDSNAVERIRSFWDVDAYIASVKRFESALGAYLPATPATDAEAFFRHQFASTSFYENIRLKEPSLPRSLFPPGYSLDSIERAVDRFESDHLDAMLRHYRSANE
jgi:DNA-binding transcriptional regulator PaaX